MFPGVSARALGTSCIPVRPQGQAAKVKVEFLHDIMQRLHVTSNFVTFEQEASSTHKIRLWQLLIVLANKWLL